MQKSGAGFTFIELLIAVAIIAALGFIGVATFKNFGEYASLRTAADGVAGTFADARNRTLASENASRYGVHIDEDQAVRFTGATYDPNATTTNVVYAFPGGVTATSSLSGDAVDVVFSRLTGEASATGTIVLTDAVGSASSTLTIHASGLIE